MSEPDGPPDEPYQLSATDFVPLPDSLAVGEELKVRPSLTADGHDSSPIPTGPGLIESCLWTGGFLATQVVLSITAMIAIYGSALIRGMRLPSVESTATSVTFLVAVQAQVILVTLLATAVRFRFSLRRALHVRSLSLTQGGLICALVLPVSLLCSALYVVCEDFWLLIVAQIPELAEWQQVSSIKQIEGFAQEGSLSALLFAIAVAPAIAEELVFRGVIGRGLTTRYGTVPGVLVCSFLFGCVHLYPPHVLAVIPLGIVLHYVYLQTRSFWAPVALHFLNNAWATVALTYGDSLPASLADETAAAPPELLVAAAVTTLALLGLFSQLRPSVSGNLDGVAAVEPLSAPRTTWFARCAGVISLLIFVALFIRCLLQ